MMESLLTSTSTKLGLMLLDNSWIGEGKCVEMEIKPGMHSAVPVEDHTVVHMTARQLSNACHCLLKNERMKANNWQCK